MADWSVSDGHLKKIRRLRLSWLLSADIETSSLPSNRKQLHACDLIKEETENIQHGKIVLSIRLTCCYYNR